MKTRKEISKEEQQHSIRDTLRHEKDHKGESDEREPVERTAGQTGANRMHPGREGGR